MTNQIAVRPSIRRAVGRWAMAGALALAIIVPATALPSFADSGRRQQLIPILGLTTDDRAIGTVAYRARSCEERADRSGLMVHFQNGPDRFSRMAAAGPVGGVALKVAAAKQARLHMVLVPDKQETAEGNWESCHL